MMTQSLFAAPRDFLVREAQDRFMNLRDSRATSVSFLPARAAHGIPVHTYNFGIEASRISRQPGVYAVHYNRLSCHS